MLERLKAQAKRLKTEIIALSFACRHPLTPWYAKALGLFVIAYALSPIDLIPDFIPILGLLDDLILLPLGIALTLKLIPEEVRLEARRSASQVSQNPSVRWLGLGLVLIAWLMFGLLIWRLLN